MNRLPPRDKRESGLFRFFVNQSVFINLVYVAVIIVGAFLWLKVMNREAFGNFDFDLVQITTPFPGATAEEVEQLVTLPLENVVKNLEGIDEMFSVSVEGISVITLKLDPDRKRGDKVVRSIEREVDQVRTTDLPEDGDEPKTIEVTAAFPVLTVGMSGDVSDTELRNVAEVLEEDLLDIDGVSRVDLKGFKEKQLWVEADEQKLKNAHLSLLDLIQKIRLADHSSPGGRLEIGGQEIIVRTLSRLQTVKDVERVVVRSNEHGNIVQVKDVARVSEQLERERNFTRFNGSRAIEFNILKKDSGDTLEIDKNIKGYIETFKKEIDPRIQFGYANEIAFYINRRLNVLLKNGMVGLFFVMLIMLLFLKPQSALWSTTAIPFAFLGGVITMYALGLTINLLSLFAFILVGGMLVDNGIVVAEYIERKREEGLSSFTAASVGISEMALPIFGAALTTILAFAPLAFMSGITGKFLRQMPLVLIACLLWDLLECLLILPGHLHHYDWNIRFPRFIQFFRLKAQAGLARVTELYGKTLSILLRWSKCTVVFLLVFLIGSLWGTSKMMKYQYFPDIIDSFVIGFENSVGASLKETERVVKGIEKIVAELPKDEVKAVVSQVGTQGDQRRSNSGTNVGEVRVFLNTSKPDRVHGSLLMESIRPEVEAYAKQEQLKKLEFQKVQGGPPPGRSIELLLVGDSYEEILAYGEKIKQFLRDIPGTIGVSDDYDEGKNEIRLSIDRAATARAGLTTAQLASVVRAAFNGQESAEIKRIGEKKDIPVLVKLPESARETLDTLDRVTVTTSRGRIVPLRSLVRVEKGKGVLNILRNDGQRNITIKGDVDQKTITSPEVNNRLEKYLEEEGKNHPNVRTKFSGEKKNQQESNASLLRAFLVSFILIYLLLASLFRSYWDPAIILSVVPFGLLGIFISLVIPGKAITLLVWIGAAGLMGVVINNSILMVDTFNRLKRDFQMNYYHTVLKGARQRLRPIILTSLSTFFGVMPLGFGIGGKEPFLQDMAYAFGWGLLVCSLFTLLWVPVFFKSSMQTSVFIGRIFKYVFSLPWNPKNLPRVFRIFYRYFLGFGYQFLKGADPIGKYKVN